jgi:hypothetical protein
MENFYVFNDHLNTLWPFALFYGYLLDIMAILYNYSLHLAILYQEKSGNPALDPPT